MSWNQIKSLFTTQKLCLPSACHEARICPADCQPIPVLRLSAGNLDDGSYLGLVGNISQDTGNDTHVQNRQPSMARGPAEVLVAVGVEFYVDQSVHVHERLRGFGPCPDVRAGSRDPAQIYIPSIAQGPSLHVDLFSERGVKRDEDWASYTVVFLEGRIKDQGCSQLINEKDRINCRASQHLHLLGPAMIAIVLGSEAQRRRFRRPADRAGSGVVT